MIEQVTDDQKAILLTATYETTGPKRLWRAAFAVAPRLSKLDIIPMVPNQNIANAHEFLVHWQELVFDNNLHPVQHGAHIAIYKGIDHSVIRQLNAAETRRDVAETRREDDEGDAINFMAHQINRDPEPLPIIDNDMITRDLDDSDADIAVSSDEEEDDDSASGYDVNIDPDTTWRSVIIFTRASEGIVGRAQETHPELCHREYAHMVGITPNSLIQAHPIQIPPADIAAAGQEAYIAQQLHDVDPGSLGRMILMDVIFCNHLPQLDVETVRQVKILCCPTDRSKLLRLLRLQRYNDRPGQACLVHHNGELVPAQRGAAFALEHGDYLCVTVPPAAGHGHVDTRLAALAHFHHLAEAAYPHLMRRIPEGMDVMQVPNPAILMDDLEAADAVALLQLAVFENLIWREQGPQHGRQQRLFADPLCRLRDAREQQQQVDTHTWAWQQPPNWIPNAFQEMINLPIFQNAWANPEEEELTITTWYLSHDRARRCNIPRPVHLGPDATQWTTEILQAWQDEHDPDAEAQFHLVHPQPYELESGILAHVLVIQHDVPQEVGIHITLFDPGIHEGRAVRFAEITSHDIDHLSLLDLADRDQLCSYQQHVCKSWSGWTEVTNVDPFRSFHGQSFAICVFRPHQLPPNQHAWDDFDINEGESLLQVSSTRRTTITLSDLVPEPTTIVYLRPSEHIPNFPGFIEVPLLRKPADVEGELRCWGYQCTAFQFGQHDVYFCVCTTHDWNRSLFTFMYVNEDTADPHGCFLHSSETDMNDKDHMQMLYNHGYIRAAIVENLTLQPGLFQIRFTENWGTLQDSALPKRAPSWPSPMQIIRGHPRPSQQLDNLSPQIPSCLMECPGSIDAIRSVLNCANNCLAAKS